MLCVVVDFTNSCMSVWVCRRPFYVQFCLFSALQLSSTYGDRVRIHADRITFVGFNSFENGCTFFYLQIRAGFAALLSSMFMCLHTDRVYSIMLNVGGLLFILIIILSTQVDRR